MWLNNLIESVKSFSFLSVVKGNILSSPGSFGGADSANGLNGSRSNSPASQMVSNRYMSTYYKKSREVNDYEISEISETCLGIYSDYIKGYLTKSNRIFTLNSSVYDNYTEIEDWTNRVFIKDLEIPKEVELHLNDIIYHGNYSFKIAWDKENQRYVKFRLCNPHNVVTIMKGKNQDSHLVVSRDGVIFQVKPESIFRIGMPRLKLINDLNSNFFQKKNEDTLINDQELVAAAPLYFNITGKIKEYLLKEQILSLLSIKDLVQPLLLLVRLDKTTAPDEANKLTLNIENMINKYSDISSILGANFSINSLIDAIMHNIRVIPDYGDSMGSMNNVDLSKITNKIQEIESSQDNKLDNILTSLSIPKALRDGSATKWDAIKSSQRLNSKINSIVKDITSSLCIEACKLIKYRFNVNIDPQQLTCNLFNKTDVDYNVAITNTQIVSELTQGIQQILSNGSQTLQDIPFIDKKEYLKYISDQLKSIDTDSVKFINDNTIETAINALQSESQPDLKPR
jgi:hypothetical protein